MELLSLIIFWTTFGAFPIIFILTWVVLLHKLKASKNQHTISENIKKWIVTNPFMISLYASMIITFCCTLVLHYWQKTVWGEVGSLISAIITHFAPPFIFLLVLIISYVVCKTESKKFSEEPPLCCLEVDQSKL